jgi:dTDP-4-amino-4,6-dideoxygalactose transaminase
MASDLIRTPCAKPLLPLADRLLPYLRRIDEARWYSNFGPLHEEFRRRLAERWGIDDGCIGLVANGTAAITLALLAQDVAHGGLCILPSWTFVATPHAAERAGLIPFFVDVREEDGVLTPALVAAAMERATMPISAVVPVASFGRQLDMAAWERFQQETGVPVVVDAAAGFDTVAPSSCAVIVSLHATKVLAAGEGGLVVSTDQSIIAGVLERANFGFFDSRIVRAASLNAKLSEYHSAVGLASLDEWPAKREQIAALCRRYGANLRAHCQPLSFDTEWVAGTCTVRLAGPFSQRLLDALRLAGIEARRWWGDGCHLQPKFRTMPRTAMTTTNALAASVISLPLYPGLTPDQVDFISTQVAHGLDALPARDCESASSLGSSKG